MPAITIATAVCEADPVEQLRGALSVYDSIRGRGLAVSSMALLRWRRGVSGGQSGEMSSCRCRPVSVVPCSAFAGFRFPPEIVVSAVRLVPALRPVVSRPGGTPRRAGHRRRSRHRVSVGAALHATPRGRARAARSSSSNATSGTASARRGKPRPTAPSNCNGRSSAATSTNTLRSRDRRER